MLTKEDKLILSVMSTTKMSARIKKQLEKLKNVSGNHKPGYKL